MPERQIGAMLWGKPLATAAPDYKDLVTYYAGIFNGNGRNFNNNDNNEFMYVGRLELLPWKGQIMGQEASLKLGGDYLPQPRRDRHQHLARAQPESEPGRFAHLLHPHQPGRAQRL